MTNKPEPEPRIEYRGTGFYVGLAAILVFALILLILAVQNTQDVTVSFLGFDFTLPVFGVAIGAGLLAVILDELIGLVWRRQMRTRLEERAELERLRAHRDEPVGTDAPVVEDSEPEETEPTVTDAEENLRSDTTGGERSDDPQPRGIHD